MNEHIIPTLVCYHLFEELFEGRLIIIGFDQALDKLSRPFWRLTLPFYALLYYIMHLGTSNLIRIR